MSGIFNWIALPLLFLAQPARAFESFLWLEGIPGESTDSAHKDWIVATSFHHSVARSGAMPPAFSNVTVTKPLDKSSPLLSLRAANGRAISGGIMEFVQETEPGARFYQIVVSNVFVAAFNQHGHTSAFVTEAVGLRFDWISWTYTELDHRGQARTNIGAYWDLIKGTGGLIGQPIFRITGVKQGPNILVTWPGQSNITYRVLGSPVATGPYNFVRTVTPTTSGVVSASFPIATTGNFFYIVERP